MARKTIIKKRPDYTLRERATIITQTPMRISLGGGGTDVLWYSRIFGGSWISAGINKYVFVMLNKTEDPDLIKVSHGTEATMTKDFRDIPNPIIRECLKTAKIRSGIEVSTAADASASSGLGGSGAFEVGLLNALYTYKRQPVSQIKLAKQASDIEIIKLKKPVGPHDQYICALGGIYSFEIDTDGKITAEPLNLSLDTVSKLENNLLYFRTGIKRDASEVLSDAKKNFEKDRNSFNNTIPQLNKIKELGKLAKKYLLKGKIDDFGQTFDTHWNLKKKLSSKISSSKIDEWYDEAVKSGALGGKIMGAGGGGWFVFYVKNSNKRSFREKMNRLKLTEYRVRFDWEGTKTLINLS